jgi:hypothetical protein
LWCLVWLELVDRDGVAERFELFLEPPGAVLNAVARVLPVGAGLAE